MKNLQENSIREAWGICLILGIIMINFPFIHIFSSNGQIFGIPSLVLYFFIGWPLSIVVIWLFVRHSDRKDKERSDDGRDNKP